jgi:O-antigen biosynthesis protein WbqP
LGIDGQGPAEACIFDYGDFFLMAWEKRIFDIVVSLLAIVLLSPVFLILALLVKFTSKGPVLHCSDRVGKDNKIFLMPKFRSMRTDTPQLPTHLLSDAGNYLTPMGGFLRRTSLDELPQLFSILIGDMSIVGPRPALFNQDDLVAMRTARGIDKLVPGLTGWAQINGRDDLPIPRKVEFDDQYLKQQSLYFDLKIICLTALKVVGGEGVKH